uniref:PF07786 family protein n=1 Tax=Strongyloides venezuelensis TaxID=75913 RepID=A0A0K0FZK7_STRVS
MGSRCTSIFAVIISLFILIGAGVLFFFGFTDFKPESTKDLLKAHEANADISKLSIIDVEEFISKNKNISISITSMSGENLDSGSLYTYPKCFYIKESLKKLIKDKSKLSSYKPNINIGQSVKFHIKPSPSANSTIDFCGEHSELQRNNYIIIGAGVVALVILSLIIILTIFILCGFCSGSNIPLVVAVIGVIGFCSGTVSFGFFLHNTLNYYTLRGLKSADVAVEYGLPKQGNNIFYLFAGICVLFSNIVFVVMMFTAARQRKREIILSATHQFAPKIIH